MDREAEWHRILELAIRWREHDCAGGCGICIDCIQEIEDIAEQTVRASDGPR